MLTLLTTTGCRPIPWEICQKLMCRQTYPGPVRWIIVDDGEEQQEITFSRYGWDLEIIRPQPYWKAGDNTQARNLLAGLKNIHLNDKLVIIEDDDYYDKTYLEEIDGWLDKHDLVGECLNRYYHIGKHVYFNCSNKRHAGLCSTGLTKSAIANLVISCKRNIKFIDIELWKRFGGKSKLYATRHVVGIKGLSGRAGIGGGHRMSGIVDPDRFILNDWLKDDVNFYV